MADEEPDVELVGILDASRSRGGSSGSWLTQECFDTYSHGIAERISAEDDIDGVLLALHGAMAVTGIPKPEAEIVRRVRQIVGDKPIMVTLDLHANEDQELTDVAGAIIEIDAPGLGPADLSQHHYENIPPDLYPLSGNTS